MNVKIKKLEENGSFIKTSIGYLPLDWKVKSLIDVCKEKGLIRGPFGGALKKEFFVAEGYKVYEQKNAIYQDAEIGDYYIDEDKFNELKRFEVSEGDFIVSCSGTIGRIFRIPKGAKKGIINQALLLIKINPQIISSDFFYQYFQWQGFQKRIIDNTQGGAMPNLVGMDIFKKTPIPLPPIEEQQKIADILSTWDKAIELKEKLIEQKKEQKKGLMQRLLTGKVRLPGFEGEWKIKKIGDILVESLEIADKPDINKRITVRLNLKGVEKREPSAVEIEGATTQYIRRKGQFIYGKQNIHKGAFGIIPDYLDGFQSSIDLPSFDFKDGIDRFWFYYYFAREHFYKNLEKIASGTGSKRVQPKDLFKIKIKVPPLEEQRKISAILQSVDKEIDLLEQELEALKQQKKGLMQLLLTGKVRVKC